MAREWTTVSVHGDVYRQLKALKRDEETFSDVLRRLCAEAEE